MIRTCLLGVLAATIGCASQPICAPWSPSTPAVATATDVPPQTTQASNSIAPASRDDGTVFLSGPSTDEEWTSVVGEGARMPATVAPEAPVVRPRAASSARSPAPAAAKKVAAVTAPKTDKPAPVQAKAAVVTSPAKDAAAPNPANNALRAEAKALYAGRCVPCHGASGRGDGPAGSALNPHPRNFTDKAWQSSVNAKHIAKVISSGGPSVGKSPLMPAQSDLSPAQLGALALYIQDFGK